MDEVGIEELLRRARLRDPEALARLVDVFSPRVFGLLYRLTGSRDAAEDLLQETFLRVVRMIGQYEPSGKFEAWLFRIAANLARDRARRTRRHGPTASFDGTRDGEPAGADLAAAAAPDDALASREMKDRLAAGLLHLTDAEREILLLRHFSELSFREIADLLGIPLGTALARAHRALQRLRSEVDGGA